MVSSEDEAHGKGAFAPTSPLRAALLQPVVAIQKCEPSVVRSEFSTQEGNPDVHIKYPNFQILAISSVFLFCFLIAKLNQSVGWIQSAGHRFPASAPNYCLSPAASHSGPSSQTALEQSTEGETLHLD